MSLQARRRAQSRARAGFHVPMREMHACASGVRRAAEWVGLFDRMDVNKDGMLSFAEFKVCVRSCFACAALFVRCPAHGMERNSCIGTVAVSCPVRCVVSRSGVLRMQWNSVSCTYPLYTALL